MVLSCITEVTIIITIIIIIAIIIITRYLPMCYLMT